MTSEEKIEALITHAPKVRVGGWRRALRIFGWAMVAVSIFLSVGAGTLAIGSRWLSEQNDVSIKGSCQFWSDLAELPLLPTSSKVALTIVADARTAYSRQRCPKPLPPADTRVAVLLPKGVH